MISTEGKEVYNTQYTNIVYSHKFTMGPDLALCNHEEADGFVHALHCAKNGHDTILMDGLTLKLSFLQLETFSSIHYLLLNYVLHME